MMKAIGRKNEGKPRDTDEVMEAQPLIVHLMALRKVIIICLAAVVIFFLIVFFGFSSSLVQFVSDPLAGQGVQVIYTEVSEAFGAQTKLSLIAGVVLDGDKPSERDAVSGVDKDAAAAVFGIIARDLGI